jgi:hypothetical protein
LSNLQGFWNATLSSSSSASAVILPDGQVWILYENAGMVSALARANLRADGTLYSANGKNYSFTSASTQDFSLSGSLPASAPTSLSNSVRLGAAPPLAMSWSYNNSYKTPLSLASIQGRWSATVGVSNLLLDVDAAGKLVGTSSAGCTYGGTLLLNPGAPAVLDAAVTETCAGTTKTLAGIALLSADQHRLSLAYTTAAGAQGGVLLLSK